MTIIFIYVSREDEPSSVNLKGRIGDVEYFCCEDSVLVYSRGESKEYPYKLIIAKDRRYKFPTWCLKIEFRTANTPDTEVYTWHLCKLVKIEIKGDVFELYSEPLNQKQWLTIHKIANKIEASKWLDWAVLAKRLIACLDSAAEKITRMRIFSIKLGLLKFENGRLKTAKISNINGRLGEFLVLSLDLDSKALTNLLESGLKETEVYDLGCKLSKYGKTTLYLENPISVKVKLPENELKHVAEVLKLKGVVE